MNEKAKEIINKMHAKRRKYALKAYHVEYFIYGDKAEAIVICNRFENISNMLHENHNEEYAEQNICIVGVEEIVVDEPKVLMVKYT